MHKKTECKHKIDELTVKKIVKIFENIECGETVYSALEYFPTFHLLGMELMISSILLDRYKETNKKLESEKSDINN